MPPTNKADMYTTFRCVPLEGNTREEIAHSYEQVINRHIHNPESQYVDEAGKHLYMRPIEYSLDTIGDGYVANITLVGTTHGPINSNITTHYDR